MAVSHQTANSQQGVKQQDGGHSGHRDPAVVVSDRGPEGHHQHRPREAQREHHQHPAHHLLRNDPQNLEKAGEGLSKRLCALWHVITSSRFVHKLTHAFIWPISVTGGKSKSFTPRHNKSESQVMPFPPRPVPRQRRAPARETCPWSHQHCCPA